MRRASIEFAPAAERDLRGLPKPQREALVAIIRDLAWNPRPPGCKAIAGYRRHYRLRIGDYRIVYELKEGRLVVLIVAVGHRGAVYRRLRRRFR